MITKANVSETPKMHAGKIPRAQRKRGPPHHWLDTRHTHTHKHLMTASQSQTYELKLCGASLQYSADIANGPVVSARRLGGHA